MTETRYFSFFQNRRCEYFPCHEGVPEEEFNCLFCFCPLYALGRRCGGAVDYTEAGCKDCTHCTLPHWRENYGVILEKYGEIEKLVKQSDGEGGAR